MSTNVVLGAASGMGAAAAALLASKGRLIVADRDADALAELAMSLGPDVTAVVCDITDDAQVSALVAATGTLGSLIVTAGLSPTMADGRTIYDVNLGGAERVIRAFTAVITDGSAAVVFASMAAHMVPADPGIDEILDDPLADDFASRLEAYGIPVDDPGFAYALSKRGVVRIAARHAATWGQRGARILSLSPGIIATGMGELEWDNQPEMATMLQTSALPRKAEAEEVARVAAFLVSDDASFMTGTDVLVDGGCVAGSGRAL